MSIVIFTCSPVNSIFGRAGGTANASSVDPIVGGAYTPGPYHVGFFDIISVSPVQYQPDHRVDVYTVCAANGAHLAYVCGTASDKSNATLFAAAPVLLAALEDIVKNDPYNQSSAGVIARAAISKVARP